MKNEVTHRMTVNFKGQHYPFEVEPVEIASGKIGYKVYNSFEHRFFCQLKQEQEADGLQWKYVAWAGETPVDKSFVEAIGEAIENLILE